MAEYEPLTEDEEAELEALQSEMGPTVDVEEAEPEADEAEPEAEPADEGDDLVEPTSELSSGERAELEALEAEFGDEVEIPEPIGTEKAERPINVREELPSAARGLVSGAAMGFGENLTAAARAGMGAKAGLGSYSDLYSTYLTEERQAEEKARKSPFYTPAEMVGSLATGAVTPMARSAQLGKRVVGATLGAGVQNVGLSDIDPTEDPIATAKAAAWGAGLGALTEFGLDKVVGGTARGMREFAQTRAAKSAVGHRVSDMRAIKRTKGVPEFGEAMLSREGGKPVIGYVPFPPGYEQIAKRAEAKAEKSWANVEKVMIPIDEASQGMSVSGAEIAANMRKRARALPPISGNVSIKKAIEKDARIFEIIGDIPLYQSVPSSEIANRIRAQAQRLPSTAVDARNLLMMRARWVERNFDMISAQDLKRHYVFKMDEPAKHALGKNASNSMREAITDTMEKSILQHAGKDGVQQWKKGMTDYGMYATAAGMADDRYLSNISNRWFTLSDYLVGTQAAQTSTPWAASLIWGGLGGSAGYAAADPVTAALVGIPVALAHKVIRSRGGSFVARASADAAAILGKVAGTPYEGAIKAAIERDAPTRASRSLIITHQLLRRKYPDYAAIFGDEQEEAAP
jgi:hypothetical protein